MIAEKGDTRGLVAVLQAKVPCGWLPSFDMHLGSAAVMWAFDFYTVYVFVLVKFDAHRITVSGPAIVILVWTVHRLFLIKSIPAQRGLWELQTWQAGAVTRVRVDTLWSWLSDLYLPLPPAPPPPPKKKKTPKNHDPFWQISTPPKLSYLPIILGHTFCFSKKKKITK